MTILFITTWLFSLVVLLIICRKCHVSLLHIGIVQFFLVLSVLISFAGYPILYLQIDEYRVATGLTDKNLIIVAMLASMWSIFGVLISYLVLEAISKKRKFCQTEDSRFFIVEGENLAVSICFWGVVLIISSCVAAIYISNVDRIALIEAFKGGNVGVARSQMTNDFPGKYHWFRLFFVDFAWISSLAFFAIAISRKKLILWCFFFVSFIVTSFFLTMTAQKAPIVFYFGTIFLVYAFLCNNRQVSLRQLMLLSAVALMVLLFMYRVIMGSDNLLSALSSVVSRSLTGQLAGAYNYQWIFPDFIDFLWGRSFPNPRGIFPFEHFPLAKEVMKVVHPHLAEKGIVGSQPTMYWGEAYANFGWLGVIIAPFYVSVFMFFGRWAVSYIRNNPLKAVATIWMGLQFGKFAFSGMSWSFLPVTLIFGFSLIYCGDQVTRCKSTFGALRKNSK